MSRQLAAGMTRECAQDLTKQINRASEDLAGMLKRAHDEGAWQALGYETWNAYVKAEIKLCKSRVFQLLDHAERKGAMLGGDHEQRRNQED